MRVRVRKVHVGFLNDDGGSIPSNGMVQYKDHVLSVFGFAHCVGRMARRGGITTAALQKKLKRLKRRTNHFHPVTYFQRLVSGGIQ